MWRVCLIVHSAKPFVKWAGGKRGIIDDLLKNLPNKINNYYEPFVGGGALFFEIYDKVGFSFLSDLNVDLIVSFNVIKKNVNSLIKALEIHEQNHNENYYYEIRNQHKLIDPIENSARFIYLMRTCYNGLYRVNKKNEFNTPIGKYKNPTICDKENLINISEVLKRAEIKYQDFERINPVEGDFVYFDPPYNPSTQGSFVNYVSQGFTEKCQLRLRDFVLELTKKGVNVMLSNSDTDLINDIYKNFFIHKIKAPRTISCKASERKSIYENLITNYKL